MGERQRQAWDAWKRAQQRVERVEAHLVEAVVTAREVTPVVAELVDAVLESRRCRDEWLEASEAERIAFMAEHRWARAGARLDAIAAETDLVRS